MNKFISVQLGPRKWIVASSTGGGPYRYVCDCKTQWGADLIRDALNTVQP